MRYENRILRAIVNVDLPYICDPPDNEATYILKYFWRENSSKLKSTVNHFIILAQKFR